MIPLDLSKQLQLARLANKHPRAHGLVGWFPMSQRAGISALDMSPFAHNGVLTNTPTWSSHAQRGLYLDFDLGDYILFTNTFAAWSGNTHTVTFWLRLDSDDPGGPNGNTIFHTQNNAWYARTDAGGGWAVGDVYISYNTATWDGDGIWRHVALRAKGTGGADIYVNGVFGASQTGTVTAVETGPKNVHLGKFYTSTTQYRLDGGLADFRVYNRVLTPIEIASLYADPHLEWDWAITQRRGPRTSAGAAVPPAPNVTNAIGVGELVQLRIGVPASATDAIEVSESVTLRLNVPVSATDSVEVGEAVTLNVLRQPKVTDAVTVAETVTMAVPVLPVSVTNAVAVDDTATIDVVRQPKVTDAVTASDTATIRIALPVVVTDALDVSDTATIRMALPVSVTDAIVVDDTVTVLLPVLVPSVTDAIEVNETATIDVVVQPKVTDNIELDETVTISLTAPVFNPTPQITNAVLVGELATVMIHVLPLSVTDDVEVDDTATIEVLLEPRVTDGVEVGESVAIALAIPVAVTDNVAIGELATVALHVLPLSVTDDVEVGELATVVIITPPAQLEVNVTDDVLLGEFVALATTGGATRRNLLTLFVGH